MDALILTPSVEVEVLRPNAIPIIKTIRILSNNSLKEAKDQYDMMRDTGRSIRVEINNYIEDTVNESIKTLIS